MLAPLSRRWRSHRSRCVSLVYFLSHRTILIEYSKIFCTVSVRIKSVWGHYLFLKKFADANDILPPSTAPCHPAPGRRLLIIRNDNQSPAAGLFVGFDGILGQTTTSSSQATAHKRNSSLTSLNMSETTESSVSDAKSAVESASTPALNKRRWTFMGKLLTSASSESGASSPSNSRSSSPPTKTLEEARRETALARTNTTTHKKSGSTDSETPPASSSHRAFSFKFSLEWTQHFEKSAPGQQQNGSGPVRGGVGFNMGAERRITTPRLPAAAQGSLGARVPNMNREVVPKDPKEGGVEKATRAKYSGRALAEWSLIVAECNNFSDRRRAEGVPSLRWVEVPTLGVEGFRRFGPG